MIGKPSLLTELTLAMRDSHLKLISDLTAAGTGLLITDFVSTDTWQLGNRSYAVCAVAMAKDV